MTAVMYNAKLDLILLLEKGLWFEAKDDSSPLYGTKLTSLKKSVWLEVKDDSSPLYGIKLDSLIGAFFTDEKYEYVFDACKKRGYVKIGEL